MKLVRLLWLPMIFIAMIAHADAVDDINAGNRTQDYDEAIRLYTRAIASGELSTASLAIAFYDRGASWYNKGDYDRAIPDFNEAIRLNPQDADYFFARGEAWTNKQESGRAIADYNEAIRWNPQHPGALAARERATSAKASALASKTPSPRPIPITEAQLRKVLNILAQQGHERVLYTPCAVALGLRKGDEEVHVRQISVTDDQDDQSFLYGFALLNEGGGYVLDKGIKGIRGKGSVLFRLDENFKIIAAAATVTASNDPNAEVFAPLPLSEAEAKLNEVMKKWAELADQP